MGKRKGRKLTRKDKIADPRIVCRKEILKGIEAGESLYHIADRIKEKYPINKDKALEMVMAEFDTPSAEKLSALTSGGVSAQLSAPDFKQF